MENLTDCSVTVLMDEFLNFSKFSNDWLPWIFHFLNWYSNGGKMKVPLKELYLFLCMVAKSLNKHFAGQDCRFTKFSVKYVAGTLLEFLSQLNDHRSILTHCCKTLNNNWTQVDSTMPIDWLTQEVNLLC